MKNIFLLILISVLFSSTSFTQHGTSYDAYYLLSRWENKSLQELSYKVLQAVANDKIIAYDKNGKALSKAAAGKLIPVSLSEPPLTKEEIKICLENGDLSVLEFIETIHTEEELDKKLNEGEDIMNYFKKIKLKKIKPFETKELIIEVHEKLVLDTAKTKQAGEIQFLRLIVPSNYSSSLKNEFVFQVKYSDVKNLGLPEQSVLDNHDFIVSTYRGNLTLVSANGTLQLSQTKSAGEKYPDRKALDASVFRFFKNSIKLYNPQTRKSEEY